MKKLIFVISFIVLSGFIFGFSATEAKAQTVAELQTQIQQLQIKIQEIRIQITRFQQQLVPISELFSNAEIKEGKILIFINNTLYQSLIEEVSIFMNDLKDDTGREIKLLKGNWDSPEKIKSQVVQNKDGLYGIFLIGDLPSVNFARAESPWPIWVSDYYYVDLDNKCNYVAGHDFYDVDSCLDSSPLYSGPWAARLKPGTGVDQTQSLKNYFNRNHGYRSGEIAYEQRFLYYNTLLRDSDYIKTDEEIDRHVEDELVKGVRPGRLYDDATIDLLIAKSDTVAAEIDAKYLEKLQERHEWVYLQAHGSDARHEYEITTEKLLDVKPNALFYELNVCHAGNFSYDRYVAFPYVFSGEGLLALAQTTATMQSNYSDEDSKSMFLLSRGENFADSMGSKFFPRYDTWIGDPTLRLRYDVPKSNAVIEIDKIEFNLGELVASQLHEITIPFKIKNTGVDPLVVNTIPKSSGDFEKDNFFFRTNLFNYTTIYPGEEEVYVMQIDIKTPDEGEYKMEGPSIISDADNNPFIKTEINFKIREFVFPEHNTLHVNSFPITGIPIRATQPGMSGTTDYTRIDTNPIRTWLIAPATQQDYKFESWSGCDRIWSSRYCWINIADGATQTVTANYVEEKAEPSITITSPVEKTKIMSGAYGRIEWQIERGETGQTIYVDRRLPDEDWKRISSRLRHDVTSFFWQALSVDLPTNVGIRVGLWSKEGNLLASDTVTVRIMPEVPTVTLEKGWNLFSPSVQEGITISAMQDNECSIQVVYFWNSSLRRHDRVSHQLNPGIGYWVAVLDECSFSVPGTPWYFSRNYYSEGSHLIGSAYETVKLSDVLGTCHLSKLKLSEQQDSFGDYIETDTMQPFRGYWLELEEGCYFGTEPPREMILTSIGFQLAFLSDAVSILIEQMRNLITE